MTNIFAALYTLGRHAPLVSIWVPRLSNTLIQCSPYKIALAAGLGQSTPKMTRSTPQNKTAAFLGIGLRHTTLIESQPIESFLIVQWLEVFLF